MSLWNSFKIKAYLCKEGVFMLECNFISTKRVMADLKNVIIFTIFYVCLFVWFYGISTFVGYLTPNPFLCK